MTEYKQYIHTVDDIEFSGSYTYEHDEDGYNPIFTVDSIQIYPLYIDLLLVIDPRVVHEIEQALLDDYLWNA
jgi:hypothetical protein